MAAPDMTKYDELVKYCLSIDLDLEVASEFLKKEGKAKQQAKRTQKPLMKLASRSAAKWKACYERPKPYSRPVDKKYESRVADVLSKSTVCANSTSVPSISSGPSQPVATKPASVSAPPITSAKSLSRPVASTSVQARTIKLVPAAKQSSPSPVPPRKASRSKPHTRKVDVKVDKPVAPVTSAKPSSRPVAPASVLAKTIKFVPATKDTVADLVPSSEASQPKVDVEIDKPVAPLVNVAPAPLAQHSVDLSLSDDDSDSSFNTVGSDDELEIMGKNIEAMLGVNDDDDDAAPTLVWAAPALLSEVSADRNLSASGMMGKNVEAMLENKVDPLPAPMDTSMVIPTTPATLADLGADLLMSDDDSD